MKLDDIRGNRIELERIEGACIAQERHELLERLASAVPSLLLWHFGAGWQRRDPLDIPAEKLRLFVRLYGPKAA